MVNGFKTHIFQYNKQFYFQSTSNTRGYPVKNKDQLDRKYICQVCDYVLRTPFQLNCGDRICQTCIEHLNK